MIQDQVSPQSIPPLTWHQWHRVLPPLALVATAALATHSVVRYRLWIVVCYLVATAALIWYQSTGRRPAPGRGALAAALTVGALAHLGVPFYSYLTQPDRLAVRWLFAGCSIATAVLCTWSWCRLPVRRFARVRGAQLRLGAELGLGVACVGYLIAAVALIRLDPAPAIDVWVTLQQAADGLLQGQNMYAQRWVDSPGVQDAFTYLPGTAVLLAPGRWLAGDVRWALVVITLASALALRLAGGREAAGAPAAALLLLLPGTGTQVEQAWTEPLLLACLLGWALCLRHGRMTAAVVFLGLGLACKQHLTLLLPVLALWPGFGPRRTAGAAGVAAVIVLPWFLASPADFWHDTVTLLVGFQPLVFADTVFIAILNETGATPPFWATGAVVLGAIASITWVVHRRDPGLPELLRWLALLLLVANLVNKQAFYNQYWLVMALVLASWGLADGGPANGAAVSRRWGRRPAARPGSNPA